MLSLTNHVTGEITEVRTATPEQVAMAWRMAQATEKEAKELKDKLKPLVVAMLNENNRSDTVGGKFQFKRTMAQRTTYDKATLRAALDEDLLDTFMVVKKKAVDDYLKENSEVIDPDTRYAIKHAVVPDGEAYEVIKLERILE